jgi:hypothetical protein
MTKRSNAFKKYNLQGKLSNAGVSEAKKLVASGTGEGSGYAFVLFQDKIMLARGALFNSNFAVVAKLRFETFSTFYLIQIGCQEWQALLGSRSLQYHCHFIRAVTNFRTLHWSPIPRGTSGANLVAG